MMHSTVLSGTHTRRLSEGHITSPQLTSPHYLPPPHTHLYTPLCLCTGPQPVIGVADVLDVPGKALLELPCPRTRTTAAVRLDVVTKHGLHYEDEFSLSFHMHFHKLLKWLVAGPLLAMAAVVIATAQGMGYDAGRSYDLG